MPAKYWIKAKVDSPLALLHWFPGRLLPTKNGLPVYEPEPYVDEYEGRLAEFRRDDGWRDPELYFEIDRDRLAPVQIAELAQFIVQMRCDCLVVMLLQGNGLCLPADWFDLPTPSEESFASVCGAIGVNSVDFLKSQRLVGCGNEG